jgi:hypothetical protein
MTQKQTPAAANTQESLTSSSTLPDFEDLKREYAEQLADIESKNKAEKISKGARKKETVPKTSSIDTGGSIQIEAEDIEDWVSMPLDIFFSRTGKKTLSGIEKKAWSRSCAKLFNKYAPTFTNKWGEEIGACICLATIFATRIEPPEIKKPEEKKPEEKKPEEKPNV